MAEVQDASEPYCSKHCTLNANLLHCIYIQHPGSWDLFYEGIELKGESRMSKNSVNLAIARPRCRHCSRFWTPDEGVSADQSYCPLCAESRRAIAAKSLGLRPLRSGDAIQGYFLPRSLRPR